MYCLHNPLSPKVYIISKKTYLMTAIYWLTHDVFTEISVSHFICTDTTLFLLTLESELLFGYDECL